MDAVTETTTARERVLAEYANDGKGRITQPGKFEREHVFAPYFWEIGLEGFADNDDGATYVFRFKAGDKDLLEWPELVAWLGRKRTLRMREDSQGFVHCY